MCCPAPTLTSWERKPSSRQQEEGHATVPASSQHPLSDLFSRFTLDLHYGSFPRSWTEPQQTQLGKNHILRHLHGKFPNASSVVTPTQTSQHPQQLRQLKGKSAVIGMSPPACHQDKPPSLFILDADTMFCPPVINKYS